MTDSSASRGSDRGTAAVGQETARPRMVFFRLNKTDLPDFITGHFDDHERCLRQFFDLQVVTENSDYDEIVDRFHPDVALFESGVYARRERLITNTHRHPEIPKIGLLDSDAYCLTRSVFLSDMDDWGIETFFTIATSATGYTPDIADRTYFWPNFADKSVFHSYPGGKAQTILLSGSRASNYPWRVEVDRLLGERFRVRALPHAGWFSREAAASMPSGEAYARSLSSALIVPTCGTVAEELVRKHLEIPAAGALLLTERTDVVEAAGFVDMENCVFADPSDVVDKVEYLLDNEDVLARIAEAGQRLAHTRHSIENRDQLRQWFDLHREAPGRSIAQPDLFGPLAFAEEEDRAVSRIAAAGPDRILLSEGRALLTQDAPGLAADRFARVLNLHYEPEAALGLVRAWLAVGDASAACRVADYATRAVVRAHGASHPDPVDAAWLIRAALCAGHDREALQLAVDYEGLRHPELDRMRSIMSALSDVELAFADRPRHRTLHPDRGTDSWQDWRSDLVRDLIASGRTDVAARLDDVAEPVVVPAAPTPRAAERLRRGARRAAQLERRIRGRIKREFADRRGQGGEPTRSSIFSLLGGRPIDTVITVQLDEALADRIAVLVGNDPAEIGLVHIGRSVPDTRTFPVNPFGLGSGVSAKTVSALPAWGRSVVVTSPAGAAHLTGAALVECELLVVTGADRHPIAEEPTSTPSWRDADPDLVQRWSEALGTSNLQVRERLPLGGEPW